MMEMGSPVGGSETSLSVGWGGDIPVFPPIAILLAVIAGLLLTVVLGRNRFLPAPFKYLFIRVSERIIIQHFITIVCFFASSSHIF